MEHQSGQYKDTIKCVIIMNNIIQIQLNVKNMTFLFMVTECLYIYFQINYK